jgi:hypothetical protein
MTKAIRLAAAAILATAAATPAHAYEWGSAEWLAMGLYYAANGYGDVLNSGFVPMTPTCNSVSNPDYVVVMWYSMGMSYVVPCGY